MGTAALPGLVDTLWRTAMRSALRTVVRWGLIGLSSATVMVPTQAQPLQAIPTLTSRVIDQTATLSAGQQGALEAKLRTIEPCASPRPRLWKAPSLIWRPGKSSIASSCHDCARATSPAAFQRGLIS